MRKDLGINSPYQRMVQEKIRNASNDANSPKHNIFMYISNPSP